MSSVGLGFLSVSWIRDGSGCRRRSQAARRSRVVCLANGAEERKTVLVVAELEAMGPSGKKMSEFFERVETHKSAKQSCYVAVATEKTFDAAAQSMVEEEFPDGVDCIIARGGTDIFQKGYRTPDPYYNELSMKQWDPKPMRWVMDKFFQDTLSVIDNEPDPESALMIYDIKDEDLTQDMDAVKVQVMDKLKEMGLICRVVTDPGRKQVQLVPVNANVPEAVKFVQQMLKVKMSCTILFAEEKSPLFGDLAEKSDNLFVLANSSSEDHAPGSRLYKTTKSGMDALVDGVMHHAIL